MINGRPKLRVIQLGQNTFGQWLSWPDEWRGIDSVVDMEPVLTLCSRVYPENINSFDLLAPGKNSSADDNGFEILMPLENVRALIASACEKYDREIACTGGQESGDGEWEVIG
jgi:hypothetical protein